MTSGTCSTFGVPAVVNGRNLRLTRAIARWACARLHRPFRRHDQTPGQFQPLTIAHGRLSSGGRARAGANRAAARTRSSVSGATSPATTSWQGVLRSHTGTTRFLGTPRYADAISGGWASDLRRGIRSWQRRPARAGPHCHDHFWVNRIIDRAAADLDMLQTSFRDGTLTAAGIPWFVAPFGRDSLIASYRRSIVAPSRAKETLRTLAALRGERSIHFGRRNRARSCTKCATARWLVSATSRIRPTMGRSTTPLFVMLFAETIRWTGDESLIVSSCQTCEGRWSGSSRGRPRSRWTRRVHHAKP